MDENVTKTNEKLTPNLAEKALLARRLIIESDVPLYHDYREHLAQLSDAKMHEVTSFTFESRDQRKGGRGHDNESSCSFTVQLASIYDGGPVYGPGCRVLDVNGDLYGRTEWALKLNYPAYGSSTIEQVEFRLAHIRRCLRLLDELDAALNSTPTLYIKKTAAELEQEAVSRELNRNYELVKRLITDEVKGMRVGSERRTPEYPEGHGVAPGTYEVYLNGKGYTANVTSTHGFTFTRTE